MSVIRCYKEVVFREVKVYNTNDPISRPSLHEHEVQSLVACMIARLSLNSNKKTFNQQGTTISDFDAQSML